MTGGYVDGMRLPIIQSQWQGFRIDSLTPDHVLDIWPEPDYPKGREAKHLSDTWAKVRLDQTAGVLLLGCDVAADPGDYAAISAAARVQPELVHTGMVKLWPGSTARTDWMWSHRGGKIGAPEATQLDPVRIAYFSLGFLYVPRRLMDLCFPAHSDWRWSEMDVGMSEIAWRYAIRAKAVYDATPKHLHFTAEHNR